MACMDGPPEVVLQEGARAGRVCDPGTFGWRYNRALLFTGNEDVQYVLLDLPRDVAVWLKPGEKLVIEVSAREPVAATLHWLAGADACASCAFRRWIQIRRSSSWRTAWFCRAPMRTTLGT